MRRGRWVNRLGGLAPGGPHLCDVLALKSQQKETHTAWIAGSLNDVDVSNHEAAVSQEMLDLYPPSRGHPADFLDRFQKGVPPGGKPPVMMDSAGSEQPFRCLRQRAVSSSLHEFRG